MKMKKEAHLVIQQCGNNITCSFIGLFLLIDFSNYANDGTEHPIAYLAQCCIYTILDQLKRFVI